MKISRLYYVKSLKLFFEVICAGIALKAIIPLMRCDLQETLDREPDVYLSNRVYKELLAGLKLISEFAPQAEELSKQIEEDATKRNRN